MNEFDFRFQRIQKLATLGKISRRDFIQLGVAAGLTLVAADKLFVSMARAEPKQGGSAKFGLAHGATTDNLDPGSYPDTFTQTAFWGAMSNSPSTAPARTRSQPSRATTPS